MSFLVAVNVTGNLCKATAKSPPMKPDVNHEDNPLIKVSNCDAAEFNFTINSTGKGLVSYYILHILCHFNQVVLCFIFQTSNI